MRLLAIHTLSALRRRERHTLLINPVLVPLARKVFDGRFELRSDGRADVIYTHLGLRHTAWRMLRGQRYVFPFHWLMRAQWPRRTLKDRANDVLIRTATLTGRVRLPERKFRSSYQGFMELQALRPFRGVGPDEFNARARADWPELGARLRAHFQAPANGEVVVFPGGTGHQVMPVDWACERLPGSIFAFHAGDPYAGECRKRGLRIRTFTTPEEMVRLGAGARRILATDSFPSHVWQVYGERVVLLLSQQPDSQVVHPGFPSAQVAVSRATCCPCRNLDRAHHPLCDAGRPHCVTWTDPAYAAAVEQLLQ